MNKKSASHEIDLSKTISNISKKRWTIVFFVMISVIISMYDFHFNRKFPEVKFLGQLKVEPISVFQENNYSAYNDYLSSVDNKNVNLYNLQNDNTDRFSNVVISSNARTFNLFTSSSFSKIDSSYLYSLFVEKLNENHLFIKGIKKFGLIKREEFKSNQDYERAVIKLAYSIERPNLNNIDGPNELSNIIEFRLESKDMIVWEELLNFVKKSANEEIRNYVKENFELLISNQNKLKQFKIEDINFEISANLNNQNIKSNLIKLKKRIQKNRETERLETMFMATPVSKLENFEAAVMKVQSTRYTNLGSTDNTPFLKSLILSILLGTFLGIIFVLISNMYKKKPS